MILPMRKSTTTRLVLLAIALVFAVLLGRTTDSRQTIDAREYERIVNDIYLRYGWLRGETSSGTVERPRAVLSLAGKPNELQDAAWEFANASYLSRDLARFNHPKNDNDAQVFEFMEGQLSRPAKDFHRVRTPFKINGYWLGTLRYQKRPSTEHTFIAFDPDNLRAVRKIAINVPTYAVGPTNPPRVPVLQGRGGPVLEDSVLMFEDREQKPVAQVRLIGNDTVVFVFESSSTNVRINGQLIARNTFARLPLDSSLLFEESRPPTNPKIRRKREIYSRDTSDLDIIYKTGGAEGGVWNSQERNALLEDVVAGLSQLGANLDGPGRQDVELTLQPRLQAHTESTLARISGAIDDKLDPEHVNHRAAIAVMDGKNGHLLALASYPNEKQLDPRRDSSRRDPELRNHNLSRMEIGSVAKIPMTVSILSSNPELASLKIHTPTKSEIVSVLGVPLDPPIKDDWQGDWLGMEGFIEHSVNKYAVTLMALAAVDSDRAAAAKPMALMPPADIYRLGDREFKFRPPGFVFEPPAQGQTLNPSVHTLPWAKAISSLFDVRIDDVQNLNWETKDAPFLPSRRTGVWRGLGEPLVPQSTAEERERVLEALSPASPEFENLRLQTIQDLRRQYLPLILGGGESRWTTIKTAEVFSTLVLGRRVQATFTNVPGEKFEMLRLDRKIRQRIANGMAAAALTGTANGLAREIEQLEQSARKKGMTIGVFAKTGTPKIDQFELEPAADAVNTMARNREVLHLDTQGKIIYRGISLSARNLSGTITAVISGRAGFERDFRQFFGRNRSVLQKALGILAQHNDARSDERDAIVSTKNNSIVASGSVPLHLSDPYGKHLVFVLALYELRDRLPGVRRSAIDISAEPKQMLAVSIAFGRRAGKGYPSPNLEAAKELLRGPVREYLGL